MMQYPSSLETYSPFDLGHVRYILNRYFMEETEEGTWFWVNNIGGKYPSKHMCFILLKSWSVRKHAFEKLTSYSGLTDVLFGVFCPKMIAIINDMMSQISICLLIVCIFIQVLANTYINLEFALMLFLHRNINYSYRVSGI